ncbi:MAG: protocatechuate 3,4-dioxygenase [Verrucomicrobiota bacterium]
MNTHHPDRHRRDFIQRSLLGSAAFFTSAGAFAEALTLTPRQTEGPFYPDKLPLDTDNDLIVITDSLTPAVGEITHLHGKVFDVKGNPLRNTLVEIWQCDANGNYLHSKGRNGQKGGLDKNFQGYGRFMTDTKGRYYFRTIKPVAYVGRTPHIHVIVSRGEDRLLTGQLYIKGEKQNERDFLFNRVKEPRKVAAMIADFVPLKGSTTGELTAKWDIVVGLTPEDTAQDRGRRGRQ